MKSVLDCSFLWFWSVPSGFISGLAPAPVHDGLCEVCRSLLWLCVEPALWACGGLASICRCVVSWHCDVVVRQTRLSEVYLHLAVLFLPPAVHHKTPQASDFSLHARPSTAEETQKTNFDLRTGGARRSRHVIHGYQTRTDWT